MCVYVCIVKVVYGCQVVAGEACPVRGVARGPAVPSGGGELARLPRVYAATRARSARRARYVRRHHRGRARHEHGTVHYYVLLYRSRDTFSKRAASLRF